MSWNTLIREYFSFSKKDRIGLIVLLTLIIFAYFLPSLFSESPPEDPEFLAEVAELADSARASKKTAQAYVAGKTENLNTPAEVFPFDPNILDAAGWTRLGLPERNIRTILKFRSKGGRFYSADELQKIWGLPPGFYDRIKNHIRIDGPARQRTYQPLKFEEKKYTPPAVVNINTGDSADFEKLPGIGPRLASRINTFRNKLGGFYSVDQVGETYGLPDSTFRKIRPYLEFSGEVKKININTATKEELSQHPYIRWKMANAITEYKKQHGTFTTLEELKKIFLVDEKTFLKVLPYLSL